MSKTEIPEDIAALATFETHSPHLKSLRRKKSRWRVRGKHQGYTVIVTN